MNGKLTLRVAAVAAILAAGLFISFYLPAGNSPSHEIMLPESGTADIDLSVDREEHNNRVVNEIVIDAESVQRVVATLQRPEEYTFTCRSTYHYGEQTGSFAVRGAVRGGLTKTVQSLPDGLYKHTILTANDVYIWSGDSLSYYKGAAGGFSVDDLALMPTYEDLIALPADAVVDGEFSEFEGEPCILAEYIDGETGQRCVNWVSIDTGLLVAAQNYDGDALVFEMIMEPVLETVDDSWFMLPSGTVVTEAD